jgi:ABC-2 type transport system ATP-binding protein
VSDPAISVERLRVAYGSQVAVDDVSFQAFPGQILGFLGPNGAGKSTTVKVLCGMLPPTSGTVRVAGFDVTRNPLEVKRRLGYVPESGALYETLTVEEHLQLVGRLYHMPDAQIRQQAMTCVNFLDLASKYSERVGALSKGMRQKVLIAAALMHKPDVLFFDEPLSGLDVNSALLFRELVRDLAAAGKTVFYSSHVLEVVEQICHRVIIIDRGRVVADGPMAELKTRTSEASLNAIFQKLTSQMDIAETARSFARAVTGA